MMTITKEFIFHAAHRLHHPHLSEEENENLFGKCSHLHGHSYRLQISVAGALNENGMIIDFHDLERIVKETVVERYGHTFLNDLDEFQNCVPTVENLGSYIFSILKERIGEEKLTLFKLKLYETPTSWVTIRG